METKKFSELDKLTELSEASNVIVEDGSGLKRFPANEIGKVKTVNGVEPDESGNVTVEVPESFSGSWNDLTDKPFGLTVDEVVVLPETTVELKYVSVADQYNATTISAQFAPIVEGKQYIVTVNEVEHSVIAALNHVNNPSLRFDHEGVTIQIQNADASYFWDFTAGMSDFNASIRCIQEVAVTIDESFIPSTIARISDIPEPVSDDHINSLIDAKLGVIENGTY